MLTSPDGSTLVMAESHAGRLSCFEIIADTRASEQGLNGLGVNPEEPASMRWLFARMVEEYARHNGHIDLLRESIDGATGD
jgi:hypothetical protein